MALITPTSRFPRKWWARFFRFWWRLLLLLVALSVVLFSRSLCSPRAAVVFNRCSRERCRPFCRNRPPRCSIARVHKLRNASSRVLLFGFVLPSLGRRLRPTRPQTLYACYYAPLRFLRCLPARCCATPPSFEFQAMLPYVSRQTWPLENALPYVGH